MQERKSHHGRNYPCRRSLAPVGNALILNPDTARRKMLACLLSEMLDIKECFESEDIQSALNILECQTVDFAIVDASSAQAANGRWVEQLRLQHPMLPVMSVSTVPMYRDAAEPAALISLEQTRRITAAVHYVQTLMRTGLSGFTIFVNAENKIDNSLANNYLGQR